MYIVIFYIKFICVWALETGKKNRALSKLFWPVSQRVQMNFIILPTMFILQCQKVQNNRQISLKGTETNFIRVVFNVVHRQVRTILVWYLPFDLH
jgi:membrane-anchored glycerophosphoryl diester phosphodiesterase (GDPDase)